MHKLFKLLTIYGVTLILIGCVNSIKSDQNEDTRVILIEFSKLEPLNFEHASFEDIILTLSVDPSAKEYFNSMVRSARKTYEVNKNGKKNELYIGGDGSRCAIKFILDRKSKTMKVIESCNNSIPPFSHEYYLYYTNNGWLQSAQPLSNSQKEMYINSISSLQPWEGVGG